MFHKINITTLFAGFICLILGLTLEMNYPMSPKDTFFAFIFLFSGLILFLNNIIHMFKKTKL